MSPLRRFSAPKILLSPAPLCALVLSPLDPASICIFYACARIVLCASHWKILRVWPPPGGGEGSDVDVLDFEDKDREVLDEPGKYGEIAFNLRAKTNISPSPSLRPRRRKPFLYADDGRR